MYCPNCGGMTLGKDCEWCGPASHYQGKERYDKDSGRPAGCPRCGDVKGGKQGKD